MPLDHLDLEPAGDMIERKVRERRVDDLRQQPRAKAWPDAPGYFGARAFALEHSKIESDRMADQYGAADKVLQLRPDRGKGRRIGDRGIVEPVNAGRVRRDRDIRPHQPPQRLLGDLPSGQPNRPDLDDPGVGRIEPGRFRVHDHGVDRDQRGRTGPVHH